MTIQYEEEFSSLMLKWRGSLWKAVLKELMVFYAGYYMILFFQCYMLDDAQIDYFTGWIIWSEIGLQYIPLSFLLGFFISIVITRWWEMFNWISWPDKLMIMVAACLPGHENLNVRKTIARWSSLQAAISWSGISVRTFKRFPTERHLVASNLMTEEEYRMYTELDAPQGKWFVPTIWIVNLIKKQYQEKKIDSVQFEMLLKQVYSYRDGFAMLYVYDWIKIPLLYCQVIGVALYGYFAICLIARQPKINRSSMETEVTIMFPLFTTFQAIFFLGWLKVGQFLMNPFGEDDDDFNVNYIMDRNTAVAHMMATDLADQMPSLSSINHEMNPILPHTRASFQIQDLIPRNHLTDFTLTDREMKVVSEESMKIEQDEEDRKKKTRSMWDTALKITKRGNKDTSDGGNDEEMQKLN